MSCIPLGRPCGLVSYELYKICRVLYNLFDVHGRSYDVCRSVGLMSCIRYVTSYIIYLTFMAVRMMIIRYSDLDVLSVLLETMFEARAFRWAVKHGHF